MHRFHYLKSKKAKSNAIFFLRCQQEERTITQPEDEYGFYCSTFQIRQPLIFLSAENSNG